MDSNAPQPLVIVPDSEAIAGALGSDDPDPCTPIGGAFYFWRALLDHRLYLTALRSLSLEPSDWGDYADAASAIDGHTLASKVHPCVGAEDWAASVKFVPDTGHSMQAFGTIELQDVLVLTVVKCPDGLWRSWRLSETFPVLAELPSRPTAP